MLQMPLQLGKNPTLLLLWKQTHLFSTVKNFQCHPLRSFPGHGKPVNLIRIPSFQVSKLYLLHAPQWQELPSADKGNRKRPPFLFPVVILHKETLTQRSISYQVDSPSFVSLTSYANENSLKNSLFSSHVPWQQDRMSVHVPKMQLTKGKKWLYLDRRGLISSHSKLIRDEMQWQICSDIEVRRLHQSVWCWRSTMCKQHEH